MVARIANFQWYLPEKIAGGSKPTGVSDVDWLVSQKISCVLSLETVCGLVEQLFAQHKITRLYLPIELEGSAVVLPTGPELLQGVMFVRVALKAKRRVYIHCNTGMLRTPEIARLIIDKLSTSE